MTNIYLTQDGQATLNKTQVLALKADIKIIGGMVHVNRVYAAPSLQSFVEDELGVDPVEYVRFHMQKRA